MQLLICGPGGWKHDGFTESLRLFRFREEVKVISGLPQQDVVSITASAYAIVYPCYFKSFDTEVLKAMKCEVPLITSDVGNLHEMCADAALYANPNDHRMIAEKMMLVFKDEKLRKQLIEKGKQQVKNYSPDKTASLFWESILTTFA